MFKYINIHLTEPICSCPRDKRKLKWTVPGSPEGVCLQISCGECGTILHVPHSRFGANFVLETDLPEETDKKPVILTLLPKVQDPVDDPKEPT